MTSLDQFNAFVASRGEGLHPKLRELFERTAASPFPEVAIRKDGMLQAGPSPASEIAASRGNLALLTCVSKNPAAAASELQSQKRRK